MKITKALSDRLDTMATTTGLSKEQIVLEILYEVPDKLLADLDVLKDLDDLDVSPETKTIFETMAEDFGLTPAGMSMLMATMIDRVLILHNEVEKIS